MLCIYYFSRNISNIYHNRVKSITISEIQYSDEHLLIKAKLSSINSDCGVGSGIFMSSNYDGSNGLLLRSDKTLPVDARIQI
jgi:hypothetical protein